MNNIRKCDVMIGGIFASLTIVFLIMSSKNEVFFNWIFERHQNILSWYIRPLFLIPFAFFAYKRSWSGIFIIIFCIFTSMFWFNKPEIINPQVKEFLEFEKEWLFSIWDYKKILLALTVPVSFSLLGLAFWKRSLWLGLSVVVLIASGKIVWSIYNASESGKQILIPAIIGLMFCILLIYYGFRRLENKK